MTELKIQKLGPIKSLNIEIKQFNLMIGEQATGKSTICKAVYLFRELKALLVDYLYGIAVNGKSVMPFLLEIDERTEDIFLDLFGNDIQKISSDMKLGYTWQANISAEIHLEHKAEQKRIAVSFSKELLTELQILENDAMRYCNDLKNQDGMTEFVLKERARLHSVMEEKVNVLLDDDMHTFYIPAGRGLLTLMADQKTRFNYDKLDLVTRRFLQFVEEIQPKFSAGIPLGNKYFNGEIVPEHSETAYMEEKLRECLQGVYLYQGQQEYLLVRDGNENKTISFQFASSGQQEMLWLLNELYILALRGEKTFVIIEEPEAHVYPTVQRKLLEYIVYYMNLTGSAVMITTHSPYMLTAANVLYHGGWLIEKNDTLKDEVEGILGKKIFIMPQKMMGYKLKKNTGTTEAVSLADEEAGELKTELIDGVSGEINRCYTELFYLGEDMDEELCRMGYFGNDRNEVFMEEVLGVIDVYG